MKKYSKSLQIYSYSILFAHTLIFILLFPVVFLKLLAVGVCCFTIGACVLAQMRLDEQYNQGEKEELLRMIEADPEYAKKYFNLMWQWEMHKANYYDHII